MERYKARLVAKGFTQKYGIDYQETFSPVVKMTTVRNLLAIVASKGWDIFQLDVNNAFLHGDLHEEVYMKLPEGLSNPLNHVCKLKKSLHGLKQASRQWFAKLVCELTHQGNNLQSKHDYSFFIKRSCEHLTVATVYVDDILIKGTNSGSIVDLKIHIDTVFSIKDLGKLHYFLGIEVSYTSDGITLTQQKFTRKILQFAALPPSRSVATPLPLNLKLLADEGDLYKDAEYYTSLIGKLNILTHTRPDISYIVQTLSQFMHAPRVSHYNALIHALRYVQSTQGQGILLRASDQLSLQAYTDSDWRACPTLEGPSLAMSSYLALLLLVGKVRSNPLSLNLHQKLSIKLCLMQHLNYLASLVT